MSDRRPEKPRPLFAGCPTHPEHADRKHDYMGNLSNYGDPCSFQIEPATVDDAIAHVRRQVESGTIKGEVVEWCRVHGSAMTGGVFHEGTRVCQYAWYSGHAVEACMPVFKFLADYLTEEE